MSVAESGQMELVSEGFVTVPTAAAFLELSRAKLYQTMENQELPFAKFGRARRIPKRALAELAQKCLVVAG
jgi:excisionase family DNA binding protein